MTAPMSHVPYLVLPYLALISFASIHRLFQRTWPDAGVSLDIGNLIFESHP